METPIYTSSRKAVVSKVVKSFEVAASGAVSTDDLLAVFEAYGGDRGTIDKLELANLLQEHHEIDGGEEPLPAEYVDAIWKAWAKDNHSGIRQTEFMATYRTYLKTSRMFLKQWLAASTSSRPPHEGGNNSVTATVDSLRLAQDVLDATPGRRGTWEAFQNFCQRWHSSEGTRLPSEDFLSATFDPLAKEIPACLDVDEFIAACEMYALRWRPWLERWTDSRRDPQLLALLPSDQAFATATARVAPVQTLTASTLALQASVIHLPNFEEELSPEDFDDLFERFDHGSKGYWSPDDVLEFSTKLWHQEYNGSLHRSLPRNFRFRAADLIKTEAAGQSIEVDTGIPADSVSEDELRASLTRYVGRWWQEYKSWARSRARSLFACPNCRYCFRLRLDENGQEMAAVDTEAMSAADDSGEPAGGRAATSSMQLYAGSHHRLSLPGKLLPPHQDVASLHEAAAKCFAAGENALALPAGGGRPALASRLLLEARVASHGSGVVVLLASEMELKAIRNYLGAVSPQLSILQLGHDVRKLRPSLKGPIYLATVADMQLMIRTNQVAKESFEVVIFSSGRGEIPWVAELDPEAPFSVTDIDQPRVVLLLDGTDELHQPLISHLKSVQAARGHLHSALDTLEQWKYADRFQSQTTESALQRMLGEISRYPRARDPVVDLADNTLAFQGVSVTCRRPALPPKSTRVPLFGTELSSFKRLNAAQVRPASKAGSKPLTASEEPIGGLQGVDQLSLVSPSSPTSPGGVRLKRPAGGLGTGTAGTDAADGQESTPSPSPRLVSPGGGFRLGGGGSPRSREPSPDTGGGASSPAQGHFY